MSKNKRCPVCGKEKKQKSLSKYDCDFCGFSNAFVSFFASQKGYETWQNNVKLAVQKQENKKRNSFASSHCLTVGSNVVSFLDVKSSTMYILLGNGRFQTEYHAVQFASSERNYAVLYQDGTVKVFGGDNEFGQKNTEKWKNIKYVETAPNCTYGITGNGTIVSSGTQINPDILKWKNLSVLRSSDEYVLGIHNDGKVSLSTNIVAGMNVEQVKNWVHLKDVALTRTCIVGLFEDGSIQYCGKADDPRSQCKMWTDMIAIAADNAYVYGLTKDGKLNVAGNCKSFLDKGRKNANEWTDVIAISCNKSGVGAITGDGEFLFAGTIAGDETKVRENWSEHIKSVVRY
jgi:hypothetical protein